MIESETWKTSVIRKYERKMAIRVRQDKRINEVQRILKLMVRTGT